jgi:hypothetical protein
MPGPNVRLMALVQVAGTILPISRKANTRPKTHAPIKRARNPFRKRQRRMGMAIKRTTVMTFQPNPSHNSATSCGRKTAIATTAAQQSRIMPTQSAVVELFRLAVRFPLFRLRCLFGCGFLIEVCNAHDHQGSAPQSFGKESQDCVSRLLFARRLVNILLHALVE